MINSIRNVDVLKGLCSLESGSVDLVIADPPYGIKKNFELPDSYSDQASWLAWCVQWLEECKRVLKPTGSLVLYGIHNYVCYLQVELFKLELNYVRQIIWHYENGFCGHARLPRATYEPLLWFTKTKEFFFDPMREPYKSQERLRYKITKNGKTWEIGRAHV